MKNKKEVENILTRYGNPSVKMKNGTKVIFARQSKQDVLAIEKLNTKELIEQWKSLYWMNYIYGQVSLNELQRIDLLELEMNDRGVHRLIGDELHNWVKQAELDLEKMNNGGEKKQCEHSFIDIDNEGIYGTEECRFCGKKQQK